MSSDANGGSKDKTPPAEDSHGAESKQEEEATSSSSSSSMEWLRQYMVRALGISAEAKPESRLDEVTFEGIARYIASDKCQKIVTMAGAGISTSAGIPDFRSPGTGLYDNLQKYNLPSPQSVFDISYFDNNPEPFFMLSKELWPGTFKPTICHYFIKLLDEKKKLSQHFTQNIDTLERVAGLTDDKLVEAHGTFNTGHCRKCSHSYTQDWMKEKIFSEESSVPKCEQEDCDGVVKPDIVFFGESLPPKFGERLTHLEECDMLIILGTSLVVQPFASLVSRVKEDVPRLYINLEKTGSGDSHPITVLMFGGGFAFDQEDNIRDVFWEGTCDNGCTALADLLGWGDELRSLVTKEHARIDKAGKLAPESGGASGNNKVSTPSKTSPKKSTPTKAKDSKAKTTDTKKLPCKSDKKGSKN